MHPDQDTLNRHGYITKRFTEYHFEVQKKDSKIIVSVWPTARKILKKYSPGPAPRYRDIVEAVEDIFKTDEPSYIQMLKKRWFDEWQATITPEMRAAQELVDVWRFETLPGLIKSLKDQTYGGSG